MVRKDRQEYSEKLRLIIGVDPYYDHFFSIVSQNIPAVFPFDLQTVRFYGYMYYLIFGSQDRQEYSEKS